MSGSSLPRLRLVLAVSLDGRLAPPEGGPAAIGGRGDRRVLEEALAWADGALLGAETLRLHGSTCLIHAPDLLERRARRGLPPQPLALVASRSGRLPIELPFFAQPVERWLLRAQASGQDEAMDALQALSGEAAPSVSRMSVAQAPALPSGFARVIPLQSWEPALRQLAAAGVQRLVVLGGASLAASLLAENHLDELQLTLCPKLLGGGRTWLGPMAVLPAGVRSGWRLLEQRSLEGDELLLLYGRHPHGEGGATDGQHPGSPLPH